MFSALFMIHRAADIAQKMAWDCGIISLNTLRCVQVIVHGLKKEVEAAPLPIHHFSLGIKASKIFLGRQQVYPAPRGNVGKLRHTRN